MRARSAEGRNAQTSLQTRPGTSKWYEMAQSRSEEVSFFLYMTSSSS